MNKILATLKEVRADLPTPAQTIGAVLGGLVFAAAYVVVVMALA